MWWSRNPSIFWGGLLVVLGSLFLLANTGVLNHINLDLVWPVALIALGVWLVAARFASGSPTLGGPSSEPRNGLESCKLEIEVGSARIDIRSAALGDQLYALRVDRAGAPPEVFFDRTTSTLRISRREGWLRWAGTSHVEAQLSELVCWQLHCRTGSVRGVVDLSNTQMSRFDCATGSSRLELNLPAPHGVVPIRVEGGSVHLDLSRPAGAPINVSATGASVHLNADGVRQDGMGSRVWRSAAAGGASDRFDVAVSGGAADVTVRERSR
ncbi:MAG: LiaI-LiaF-like domain-containing protein [Candidatus Dormibacterales bacterium]